MARKNDKRNQHYVPKCYLRNFSDNDEFIATFMHSKNKFVQNASLNSVAFREYLYGKDLVIENIFEKLEGKWAEAFKAIISNKDVSEKEAAEIVYQIMSFIAFQNSRTLRVYDTQKESGDFLTKFTYEHSASDDSAKELLQRYLPNGYNPMEAPFNTSISTIETFKDLSPLLIENKSAVDFITSDNPVVLYNKFLVDRGYEGNYGLSAIGLCIFLPLSPKICICLFDPKIYFSTNNEMACGICEETVQELNKLFCRNAYEFIFFTKRHSMEYALELDHFFVDKLESKTSLVQSNIGPIIHLMSPSILEHYDMPFITIRKNSKRVSVPRLGPAPQRFFRKTVVR